MCIMCLNYFLYTNVTKITYAVIIITTYFIDYIYNYRVQKMWHFTKGYLH
jgi:hypothetical protein